MYYTIIKDAHLKHIYIIRVTVIMINTTPTPTKNCTDIAPLIILQSRR